PKLVLMNPLRPGARAEGVPALGPADVVGLGVVFSYATKGVIAGRRRDSGWGHGGGSTPDDNLSGITPRKKHEVCRQRYRGSGYLLSNRASPPNGQRIHHTGGENMRLLQA